MKQDKTIIILFSAIVAMLLFIGVNYFSFDKQLRSRNNSLMQEENNALIEAGPKVLKSVILDTDKKIYEVGENITALVLIKNEFSAIKNWTINSLIKEYDPNNNSSPLVVREKTIKLNPEEISRQEIVFNPENKLMPGKYQLELLVLEKNQKISLKSALFEIK